MIKENHIAVNKTARYFTLGKLSERIRSLWIILHGYGQAAESFLKKFEALSNPETLIVAPEALSRFYWEGFEGEAVASWMTKADRENEIMDYINYLDSVYAFISSKLKQPIQLNLLGFSQGCATASRWHYNSELPLSSFILYAGNPAHDINWEQAADLFSKSRNFFIAGNEDPFISESRLKIIRDQLTKANIHFEEIRFQGGHTIDNIAIKRLSEKIKLI